MWMLLVSQLIASSMSARLTPAEAVRVLRGSHSPQDLTDYRAAPLNEPRIPVVLQQQPRAVETRPALPFVPLTCCGVYHLRLPHPVVEVIVRKEGR